MEAVGAKNKSIGIWIFICIMQFRIAMRCRRQYQKINVLYITEMIQNLFHVYYFSINRISIKYR